jgi:hypothetical protein
MVRFQGLSRSQPSDNQPVSAVISTSPPPEGRALALKVNPTRGLGTSLARNWCRNGPGGCSPHRKRGSNEYPLPRRGKSPIALDLSLPPPRQPQNLVAREKTLHHVREKGDDGKTKKEEKDKGPDRVAARLQGESERSGHGGCGKRVTPGTCRNRQDCRRHSRAHCPLSKQYPAMHADQFSALAPDITRFYQETWLGSWVT